MSQSGRLARRFSTVPQPYRNRVSNAAAGLIQKPRNSLILWLPGLESNQRPTD